MDWSKVEQAAYKRGMVVSMGDEYVWVGYPGRGSKSFVGRVYIVSVNKPEAAMHWLVAFPVVRSGRA